MPTASGRIFVLVTPLEKARIRKAAKTAGLSMGEYLRRAASCFRPKNDDELLSGLLDQVMKTTETASQAIDRALTEITASQARIEVMERARWWVFDTRLE